jgi:iron complex transport system ATP-binding protein
MAARFSDRIILLNQGHIVKTGTVPEVINEETLKPIYQIDMVVRKNQLTDSLELVALRKNKQEPLKHADRKIHVICGGGSGGIILEELRNKGYLVSCGVINISDSDYEVCTALNIVTAAEKPYWEITDESYAENKKLIAASDTVILTDVAVGNGNLRNLEILKEFPDKKIYIVKNAHRDYTHGKADAVIEELLKRESVQETDRQTLTESIQEDKF